MTKTETNDYTMSILAAAKELGVGLNQAYEAADRGEIPTIRIGRRRLVLTIPFRKMLRGESSGEALSGPESA